MTAVRISPPEVDLAAIELLVDRHHRFVEKYLAVWRPVLRHWFRADVRGVENIPAGGALLVGNHSAATGITMTTDMPVMLDAMVRTFGHTRPLYTLVHDALIDSPIGGLVKRIGALRADRDVALAALQAGVDLMVFPGGDFDASRPTWQQAMIDFGGRTGYVRTALAAGKPIVPFVGIGGQETHLFLSRGDRVAKFLHTSGLAPYLPVSIGFPFGLTVLPVNIPLPSKHVVQVLEPIDVRARFGEDVEAADRFIRAEMQRALSALAAERRFPLLG